MMRLVSCVCIFAAAVSATACQSPTSADDATSYDEVVDVAVSPNPIVSETANDGRTYRVVRGNNQPDEIHAYDWHTVFSTTLSFNNNATNKDVDLTFPIKLSATTIAVKQASGGIVTTPTGGETEKFDFVITAASGNQVSGIGTPLTTTFETWYHLPSLRREAVITVTFSFVDTDGASFQKSADFRVSP
jgi:hypothetical protein